MIFRSTDELIFALSLWLPCIAAAVAFGWWKHGPVIARTLAAAYGVMLTVAILVPTPWNVLGMLMVAVGTLLVRGRASLIRLADAELDDALPSKVPRAVDRVLWEFGTLGFDPPTYTSARSHRTKWYRADLMHTSRGVRAHVIWVPGSRRIACAVTSAFAVGSLVTANRRSIPDLPDGSLHQFVADGSPDELIAAHANALAHLKDRGLVVVELPATAPLATAQRDVTELRAWVAAAPWRRTLTYIARSRRFGGSELLVTQPEVDARIAALIALQPAADADASG